MTTPLSVWQELLLLALAALSTIYVFYFRIWLAVAVGSDVLFALALALTVAAIAIPTLFHDASTALIDRSPLPAALARADARVAEIEALPRTLIDRALARIGYGPDKTTEKATENATGDPTADKTSPAIRQQPDATRPTERPAANTQPPIWSEPASADHAILSGPFVASVRPSVEALVATVLRFASFACGSFLILTALAMRSSTTTARRLHEVSARVEALEAARVAGTPPSETANPGAKARA